MKSYQVTVKYQGSMTVVVEAANEEEAEELATEKVNYTIIGPDDRIVDAYVEECFEEEEDP